MAKQTDHDSAEDLLAALSPFNSTHAQDMIFRGHSKSSYRLIPSALRSADRQKLLDQAGVKHDSTATFTLSNQQTLEYLTLLNFVAAANESGLPLPPIPATIRDDIERQTATSLVMNSNAWPTDEFLDIAALAQHHGLATRLLDWTYDAYVATYFAARGAVIRLKSEGATTESAEYISVWMLRSRKASSGTDLSIVRPPYAGNPNLAAQRGVFTLWRKRLVGGDTQACQLQVPLDEAVESVTDLEDSEAGAVMMEHRLETARSPELLSVLDRAGYGAARCFPGYEGAARSLRERGLVKSVLRRIETDRRIDRSEAGPTSTDKAGARRSGP